MQLPSESTCANMLYCRWGTYKILNTYSMSAFEMIVMNKAAKNYFL
jgi:hypothetical protein